MKRSISLIVTLLVLSSCLSSFSQNLRNRELVLITFNFTIHQQVRQNIDGLSHLFPDVENKKADRIVALLKDKVWFLLEEMLQRDVGIYILPINTYGKSFSYDEYNYPNVTINRALRNGSSRFYLRVDVNIGQVVQTKETPSGPATKTSTNGSESKPEQLDLGFIPEVITTLTFYSDKGIIPIQKVTGNATATSSWQVSKEIFTGVIDDKDFTKGDPNTIMALIYRSFEGAIAGIRK
jgi:hypothetical protein